MRHLLGVDDPNGAWYLFYSGVFGVLVFAAGSVVNAAVTARKHNCEVHGCWRIGRHVTAAGHHVCRLHHPDDHLTAEKVRADHEAAG